MDSMDEQVIRKIQPNSIECEQAVLSSMLTSRDAVIIAADILRPEDFYQAQYINRLQGLYKDLPLVPCIYSVATLQYLSPL